MLSTHNDIEELSLADVPLCVPFAQAFHAEMQLPGELDPYLFIRNWTTYLTSYPAAIGVVRQDGRIYGGLGCMIVPDAWDGRPCAHEMFWFIEAAHRTGTGALRLLKWYERWAKEYGAVEVRMVHLIGKHDRQLSRIYEKFGYRLLEQCYRKPL